MVIPVSQRVGLDREHAAFFALGGLNAAVGLVAAIFVALGLSELVGSHPRRAVLEVAVALAMRALVALGTERFVTARQRQLRSAWHRRSSAQLARSSPSEIASVDSAIDHISEKPGLDVVEAAAVTALAGLAPLFFFGGWLCLLIVVVLIGASVPVYVKVGRQSEALAQEFERRRSVLLARQLQLLRAVTDLRALGAVEHGADEIAAASNAENRFVLNGVRVTIRSALVTEFLSGVSVGLVAMVAGLRLWHHSISLSHALGAVLVTAELFTWLRRYGAEFHRRDDATHARSRLDHWRSGPEIDTGATLLRVSNLRTGAPCQDLSLSVEPGGRIFLSGPSGVGKSSFLDTALGLREPLAGSVRRGATRIGLVRTDNHFVPGTVRENVALDGSYDDDEIRAIVRAVGLDERFGVLDATITEDARSLSTGERVQLALARALLADVELLVLDDVASVLDVSGVSRLTSLLDSRPQLAIIEAAHDRTLLARVDQHIQLRVT